MSELVFTSDESDWVFDYVMNIFRSPAWEVPVMCFIDENCASFDTGDENKFVYTDLHQQFREVGTVYGVSRPTAMTFSAAFCTVKSYILTRVLTVLDMWIQWKASWARV